MSMLHMKRIGNLLQLVSGEQSTTFYPSIGETYMADDGHGTTATIVDNHIHINFLGVTIIAYPTGGDLWFITEIEDEPEVPGGDGSIYNPWGPLRPGGVDGWESHGSYSAGGDDWGLAYGTDLLAPAAGTLHTSGGSGEFATGWVGSAGRREILYLDVPVSRLQPQSTYPYEAPGPMVAIVLQHLSAFGDDRKHFNKGEGNMGKSGASANGSEYGGDVHLHVHGLDAAGNRVDFIKFCP